MIEEEPKNTIIQKEAEVDQKIVVEEVVHLNHTQENDLDQGPNLEKEEIMIVTGHLITDLQSTVTIIEITGIAIEISMMEEIETIEVMMEDVTESGYRKIIAKN